MFSKSFGKYVCEGDTITATVDGFDVVATVYRDDCGDAPDERQDGFWPSLDSKSAGFVYPENFEAEHAKAERVMRAWRNDEWFYCGIDVTVSRNGVPLTDRYANALWGIEANYPDTANEYLLTVANELLPEAIEQARARLRMLCDKSGGIRDVNETSMVAAHKSGIAYWNRNKPAEATKDGLESLARSFGWHGVDADSFVAGVLGAKRREAESL